MSRHTVTGVRAVRGALVVAVLLLGVWLGGHPHVLPDPVADVFVEDGPDRVVAAAIERIDEAYIDKVDAGELADAAIAGAVAELDDEFSAYLDPQEYARYRVATEGHFEGVGVTIRDVDAGLEVVEVIEGGPADGAGIRRGDVIVAADGRSLADRPVDAATALIKGPAGTEVELRLRRGERTLTRDVRREPIDLPAVQSELLDVEGGRIQHLTLQTFSRGAHEQVERAIDQARERGIEGIVLDLRGNGGGLIKEAQLVASAFLQEGEIVTTRGRSVASRTLSAVGEPAAGRLPTVVLVDGATASASEIVAGALQDQRRARVVGTETFGKGVFQSLLELDNGGALSLTTGRYYTPDGRNLAGAGIEPDIRAENDPDTDEDEALTRALEVLAPGV